MSNPVNSVRGNGINVSIPPKSENHFWRDVFIGSVSGISAVSLIQPMIFAKNKRQTEAVEKGYGRGAKHTSFPKDPRIWYRGVVGFAASFAPTVAIQTAANGIFSGFVSPFYAAIAAGATSTIVVCPAEGVMIQQQQTGKGFFKTVNIVYSSYGIRGFFRAFLPTAVREMAFAGAYLGGVPIIKEKIQSFGVNEWIAQVAAGIISGSVAAVTSHPMDTIKTQMQKDFSMKKSISASLFNRNAFAGVRWRIAMIVTATTVMPFVQNCIRSKMTD